MDQVKEIVKQLIKYRFWIAVGLSLLFPAIAYVVGSGPIKAEAAAQTATITKAKKDVEQYGNGTAYNNQYKPIIDGKTAEVAKDVRHSWQKLYARQAPLLTWPESVQQRFTSWGRKWPEEEDASRVQVAIIEYVQAYPKFVTEVYNSFRPYDYAEGTGIVAAPSETVLLKPAPFKEDAPPELGKVWAAQERLWIQRSLLEVINEVNKTAKTWDAARIKAIKSLEVGSQSAQDQLSMANGEVLEEAPAITDPKAPPPATTGTSGVPEGMSTGATVMGGLGATAEKPDVIFYLTNAAGANAPYKIMPIEVAVLIEQDHIQDFLSALENSPMAIQVKEFALAKPGDRVTKPEKGQNQNAMSGYNSMMGSMMSRGRTMGGYGGSIAQMSSPMMMMSGAGGGGGIGTSAPTPKGKDMRSVDRRKEKEKGKDDEDTKTSRPSAHDPYFNVVEVTVYGQVRFYNPPPPEPPADPSTAAAAPSPGEEPAKADGEKPATEPAKEGEAMEKKDDDAPKADGEKPDGEPAKEGEAKGKKEGDDPAEKDKAAAPKNDADAPKNDEAAKEKAPAAKPEEPAKDKDADEPAPAAPAPK